MAGGASPGRGPIVGINVTPLVDVTLVLLVVLMVTAKIVVAPAVPLDLPVAGESEGVQVVFSVLLPDDGTVRVNGTPMGGVDPGVALEREARAALAGDPELRAVIQADGAVPHREVIAVLNTLKRVGVTRVAFGALPGPAAGGGAP